MPDKALVPRQIIEPKEILTQLHSGQLLRVYGRRPCALIICHRHHAELAGPGAVVGSVFDLDCRRVIPIGKLAVIYPQTRAERIEAYTIRQQWICFTQKAMQSHVPLQRARAILLMLEKYFDAETVGTIPDELLSQLVGVLPKTISMARRAVPSLSPIPKPALRPVVVASKMKDKA